MDGIRELGRLNDTLVVVVGDHGELLDPLRPLARHAGYLDDAVLRVPLLMSLPGALPTGRRVAEQVGLLDLAPTVLDLLDVPAPAQFRGRSMVPLIEGKDTRLEQKVYFETLYWTLEEKRGVSRYGIRTPELKFILNLVSAGGTSTRQEELYDLKTDPAETRNLLADPKASVPYSGRLESLRREVIAHAESKNGQRRTLTQGDEERLRALGYLGEK
jgi:arylsulfatase A-like enzyme